MAFYSNFFFEIFCFYNSRTIIIFFIIVDSIALDVQNQQLKMVIKEMRTEMELFNEQMKSQSLNPPNESMEFRIFTQNSICYKVTVD